jgi:hypothetical protein
MGIASLHPSYEAGKSRTFHSLADGRGSDVDVILIGGLRLWPIQSYEAEIVLMILELVFLVDLAVALEPARHGFFARKRPRRMEIA